MTHSRCFTPALAMLFTLLASLTPSLINAQIANGSFESWSSNAPTSWTTIDSGIQVSQTTSPRIDGSSSAKVIVSTGTQSNTDLSQQVDVLANQTYLFRASVYHTEGQVRARLVVDGYRVYSNPNLVNQWQTIEYSHTSSSNASINVGLRFYDLSGFDGSETVYVDYFRPSLQITPAPTPPSGCTDTELTVTVTSDNYGSETAWQLTDANNQVLGGDSNLPNNTTVNTNFCLTDGDYQFTITDSYGDGICCSYGSGQYEVTANGQTIASGGDFTSIESKHFSIGDGDNNGGPTPGDYYEGAAGLSGQNLKAALHSIIKDHAVQGYSALWGFYSANELDLYYENDGSILDIYSENPNSTDPYNYTAISDQCGGYTGEGDCYNREHSFPRSWFGGSIEPMNSDVHHIFASDGKVNSVRGSFPYGDVTNANTISNNGSRLGTSSANGYNGNVFEPIDEFKGDIARAQFYMATRYQSSVASWENHSQSSDAALNGTSTTVFEAWYLSLLKSWHQQDPVSQKEIDRNNAAFVYQGNRNPFIDHPEFVNAIWP